MKGENLRLGGPIGRERLTWQEICARYPDEWVGLIEVEYENGDMDDGDLVSAVVIGHSTNRADCYRMTKPILLNEEIRMSSHLFTGRPIPQGLVSPQVPGHVNVTDSYELTNSN